MNVLLLIFNLVFSGCALKVNQGQSVDAQHGTEGWAQNADAQAMMTQKVVVAMAWGIGYLIAISASVSDSGGMVLRKYALNDGEGKLKWHSRSKWWSGFFLSLFSAVLEGIAMSMVSLSLISPLGGLSGAVTVILSAVYLGEKMQPRGILATCVIVLGTTLTSIFGSHAEGEHSLKELASFLPEPPVTIYLLTTLVMWAVSAIAIYVMQRGQSSIFMNYSEIIFANFVGSIGSMTSVAGKCFANILTAGMTTNTEIMVGCFAAAMTIIFGAMQYYVLNLGMIKHEAGTLCGQYKALVTVYSCIGGGICFQEFNEFTGSQWFAFQCSVLVVCIGLLLFPPPSVDKANDLSIKGKTLSS